MSKGKSLEDIAKLSGVSRSTVSRVINDQGYVSDESREKVLQVVREHNFQPNLAARALASQRSKVVGVLIPHDVSDLFTDPFFPTLLRGITAASNKRGYGVTLWLAAADQDPHSSYINAFNNSMIDGLLIASATFDNAFLSWLTKFPKPIVFVGQRPPTMPQLSFVDIDNVFGAKLATRHLLEIGCRRIGMIEGRPNQIASDQRRDNYIATLKEWKLPIDPALIVPHGNYTERGGYEAMQHLLSQQVDGVFAANDMMALGALRAIREAGLRVPYDIAVIGFDDVPFASLSTPPLSTISQPIGLLGEETTAMLIDLLENTPPQPMFKILPVELVVRDSTMMVEE
jgi:LacI family transcriptional regulator